MGRRRAYPPLDVYMNARLVGQFARQSGGAHLFTYAQSWLDWPGRLPISRALPLQGARHQGAAVIAVFDNLLPDHPQIRDRLAARVGAGGADAFSLLAEIGRDCVGALQFLPAGEVPDAQGLQADPLSAAQIGALLSNLSAAPLGLDRTRDFRISVAGAQEKTALLRQGDQWFAPRGATPTTHILKPAIGLLPSGVDLRNAPQNEHFCLRLLAGFGLRVADTQVADFNGLSTLVVTRFDRLWTADGRLIRLPQEDCCQALGVPSSLKYQSDGGPGIREISALLQASDQPVQDRLDFFKANILFWLMGATDGHAKNFSLSMAPGGRFRLAPLYDVISLQPALAAGQMQPGDMRLAMRMGASRYYRIGDITGRHILESGLDAGLSRVQVLAICAEIAESAAAAFEAASDTVQDQEMIAAIRAGFDQRLPRLMTMT
ncbi:type II toxin-antitoxin system HipA family toxin [Ketogulonicigenium vulgare]|uniref:HipA-like protein n=1 Tax=Ketogulonicigenium vulgare (strain WSH-001) TaxID=759362 RepID=F9YBJ5_KETVW|nr:HipA-like protein [Ketogulonicigenium vulgare WSH-001]ALJ82806.1 toxin HipA [Ketogulonicigenium vulgare]